MRFMNQIRSALPLVLIAVAAAGCATTRGEISNGRYTSPLGNFSIDIPPFAGLEVEDSATDEGGMVHFLGANGGGWHINYFRMPSDRVAALSDPVARDAQYRGLTQHLIAEKYQPNLTGTTVLHEQLIDVGGERAYFALIRLPEASQLWTAKTRKFEDQIIGLLVFAKADFSYVLSIDLINSFTSHRLSAPITDNVKDAREILERFRSTLRFM